MDQPMTFPGARITDEELAGLLKATGARPAAPPDRAARVRGAAHAAFKRQADRRARSRRTWGALGLAAAALVLVSLALPLLRPGASPLQPVARIERVEGAAAIRSGGFLLSRSSEPRPGGMLGANSQVSTSAGGRLAFRMTTGRSVRLAPGTRIQVLGAHVLRLEHGALYVDSSRVSGAPDPIEIRTTLGSILETGTQFEVRVLEDSLRVRVRQGSVELRRPEGALGIPAGREIEMDSSGTTRDRDLSPYDAEWSWVSDIAPPMEIEGRTLREFLDWVAREKGLKLQFAGEPLEAAASTIVLRGTIAGLDVDQALDSVLLTSRMSRQVAGDTLRIEGMSPAGPRP
jgi:ferric-dicitrate binding protein FerR (iron transport regulator)